MMKIDESPIFKCCNISCCCILFAISLAVSLKYKSLCERVLEFDKKMNPEHETSNLGNSNFE